MHQNEVDSNFWGSPVATPGFLELSDGLSGAPKAAGQASNSVVKLGSRSVETQRDAVGLGLDQSANPAFGEESSIGGHIGLEAKLTSSFDQVEKVIAQKNFAPRKVDFLAAELGQLVDHLEPLLSAKSRLRFVFPVVAHLAAQIATRRQLDLHRGEQLRMQGCDGLTEFSNMIRVGGEFVYVIHFLEGFVFQAGDPLKLKWNEQSMKILFVTASYPPDIGGVGVSAQRIAQGLRTWCERVDVLCFSETLAAGAVESVEDRQVVVHRLGESHRQAESNQLMEASIRALHGAFDYDVVVAFYATDSGMAAVFTACDLGVKSVLCLRGNDLDRGLYSSSDLAPLLWSLQNATQVVGVSREILRKAELLSGRQGFQFIANSVDSELFSPLPTEPVPRRLLFTGELRLKKGSSVLFPALSQLQGEWSLVIAGAIRKRAKLDYKAWKRSDPEAARRITFLPYERDLAKLRRLYNEADLVLNPALWDGMPNSVLEAMACGRPVLTTRVGGMPDFVEDGVTGYLIDVAELGDLAFKIEEILADPGRQKIGAQARQHILAEHRPQQEIKAFRELICAER